MVPVFISVDPERDTVQQVHEYVKGRLSSFYLRKTHSFLKKVKIHIVQNIFL